jgi:hypothetical protein
MKRLNLPSSVEIVAGPSGPRFRGSALPLRSLAKMLRGLSTAPTGLVCRIGSIELYVTNDPNDLGAQGRVALPDHAWIVLASKFVEVTAGWEDSPFDFADCGYLHPKPDPDLGIELVGDPIEG